MPSCLLIQNVIIIISLVNPTPFLEDFPFSCFEQLHYDSFYIHIFFSNCITICMHSQIANYKRHIKQSERNKKELRQETRTNKTAQKRAERNNAKKRLGRNNSKKIKGRNNSPLFLKGPGGATLCSLISIRKRHSQRNKHKTKHILRQNSYHDNKLKLQNIKSPTSVSLHDN